MENNELAQRLEAIEFSIAYLAFASEMGRDLQDALQQQAQQANPNSAEMAKLSERLGVLLKQLSDGRSSSQFGIQVNC